MAKFFSRLLLASASSRHAMSVAADTSASPLTAECALAKSAKGAACVQLVGQVLDNPSLYVFGELLDMPNVQALADGPPAHAAAYELLKIFAYGTWKDYTARAAQLGQLSAAQVCRAARAGGDLSPHRSPRRPAPGDQAEEAVSGVACGGVKVAPIRHPPLRARDWLGARARELAD